MYLHVINRLKVQWVHLKITVCAFYNMAERIKISRMNIVLLLKTTINLKDKRKKVGGSVYFQTVKTSFHIPRSH